VSGILCEHCTATCCRYIALPLDKPGTAADFDDLRWFLIHEGVSVFVEDGDWYIALETPCRHLQPDHHCAIYATRPAICRRYSTADCDYHSGDYGWQQHFTCPEHLEEYLRQRGGNGQPRAVRPGGPQRDRRGVCLPPLPMSSRRRKT
jgi:Fe-S-cluster containining protein